VGLFCVEQHHHFQDIDAVTVRKFGQGQPVYLVVLELIDVRCQVLLKGLILQFSLTVSLQVVCSTELLFDAQVVADRCPKFDVY
jgi:hypothetical protein